MKSHSVKFWTEIGPGGLDIIIMPRQFNMTYNC